METASSMAGQARAARRFWMAAWMSLVLGAWAWTGPCQSGSPPPPDWDSAFQQAYDGQFDAREQLRSTRRCIANTQAELDDKRKELRRLENRRAQRGSPAQAQAELDRLQEKFNREEAFRKRHPGALPPDVNQVRPNHLRDARQKVEEARAAEAAVARAREEVAALERRLRDCQRRLPGEEQALAQATQALDILRADAVPASNQDLQAVIDAAAAIEAQANGCLAQPCPVIDCAEAARLLQALVDAETWLAAMLEALTTANAQAMANFNNIATQATMTGEQLADVQWAQALSQFWYNLGSILLDIASLGDFMQKVKDLGDEGFVKGLDGIYEAAKDAESLLDTLRDHVHATEGTGPVNDAVNKANEMLGTNGITDLNSLKSDLSDLLEIIEELRKEVPGDPVKTTIPGLGGKLPELSARASTLIRSGGQLVGRIAKGIAADRLKELADRAQELTGNLPAENAAQGAAARTAGGLSERRFMAEEALARVRAARLALAACMAKANCPPTSLTRPRWSDFAGWAQALRYFNSLLPRVTASLASGGLKTRNSCPGGTGTGVDGGRGTATALPGNVTPRHRVDTACPPCRPLTLELGLVLDELDFWRQELAGIRADLERADALERELTDLERQRRALRDGLRGKSGTDLANALGALHQARQGVDLHTRRILQLRARQGELPGIEARIAALAARESALRARLAECEGRCERRERRVSMLDWKPAGLALCAAYSPTGDAGRWTTAGGALNASYRSPEGGREYEFAFPAGTRCRPLGGEMPTCYAMADPAAAVDHLIFRAHPAGQGVGDFLAGRVPPWSAADAQGPTLARGAPPQAARQAPCPAEPCAQTVTLSRGCFETTHTLSGTPTGDPALDDWLRRRAPPPPVDGVLSVAVPDPALEGGAP